MKSIILELSSWVFTCVYFCDYLNCDVTRSEDWLTIPQGKAKNASHDAFSVGVDFLSFSSICSRCEDYKAFDTLSEKILAIAFDGSDLSARIVNVESNPTHS